MGLYISIIQVRMTEKDGQYEKGHDFLAGE